MQFGENMKKFEVKQVSNSAKAQAYKLWTEHLINVQKLAELDELNIYHLQYLKEKGNYYSNIHEFALNLMIKLKVNEIKPNNIKFTELRNGVIWATIFNNPAYLIFKKFYEKQYVQYVYSKKMGLEK